MKPNNPDILDNPVWSALTSKQAHLRQGDGLALRFHPEVAPFGAVEASTPEAIRALAALTAPDGYVALLALAPLPAMSGVACEQVGLLRQMIAPGQPRHEADDDIVELGMGDVTEMLALIAKTKPGPFASRTIEMGNYIGIRHQGRLIAMAGERMKLEGYTEISAVCVDDDHRGKGLAGRLMNILRRNILRRGEVPFLHVFDQNEHAIALYERLGFETRQKFIRHRIAGK